MKIEKIELKKVVAAIYIRVSTNDERQDESYVAQLEMIKREIMRKGFAIFDVYQERETARKLNGRDEFERLLTDIANRKFDVIFAKDLSRLARNLEVSQRLKRLAIDNGVSLFTITDGESVEQNGLMYNIKSLTNEQFSRDLSEKMKVSLRAKARNGGYGMREAPYGYRIIDKTLVKYDEDISEIINRIYDQYIEGHGVDYIAQRLNELNIPTPASLKAKKNATLLWVGKSIRYILTNRAYIGDLVQLKEEQVSLTSNKRRKGISPVITSGHHESIISEEKFTIVQELIKKRGTGPRSTPKKHLFTDHIYCSECGNRMWYRKSDSRYLCGTYLKFGPQICLGSRIKEDFLVVLINKDLAELTGTIEIDEKEIERTKRQLQLNSQKNEHKKKAFADKLLKLDENLGSLVVAKVTKEITQEEFDLSKNVLNRRVNEIKTELERLNQTTSDQQTILFNDMLKEQIKGIKAIDVRDPKVLSIFIDKIIVKRDQSIEIVYNLSK